MIHLTAPKEHRGNVVRTLCDRTVAFILSEETTRDASCATCQDCLAKHRAARITHLMASVAGIRAAVCDSRINDHTGFPRLAPGLLYTDCKACVAANAMRPELLHTHLVLTRNSDMTFCGLSRSNQKLTKLDVSFDDTFTTCSRCLEARKIDETPTLRNAVYAGSFDPLTNGHLNIIRRGRVMFDRIFVAVATNIRKAPIFSVDERIEHITAAFREDDPGGIFVEAFDGLLVEYARSKKARALLRGLRNVSDFEYEFPMARTNQQLAHDIETVFVMTGGDNSYVSSSMIKEVARFGGDITKWCPPLVTEAVAARVRK